MRTKTAVAWRGKRASPRRWQRLLLGLALALLTACGGCADVDTHDVGISYIDGYAAPGESVRLVAYTRRSLGGNVYEVKLDSAPWAAEGSVVGGTEEGVGHYITSENSFTGMVRDLFLGSPYVVLTEVAVPIPPDTGLRGRIVLPLRLHYSRAVYDGPGSFRRQGGEQVLLVPVTIVSPGFEWLVWLRDLAGRLALGLALMAVFRVVFDRLPSMIRWSWLLSAVQAAACGAYAYGAVLLVSNPVAAKFGIIQTGPRLLVWAAIVLATSWLFDRAAAWWKARATAAA